MKRKFIFLLTMCIFGLTGLLKAQDDVVTIGGDATSESSVFPIPTYYGQSFSQTLYTATAINHVPATITSIAFKKNSDDAVRNLTVYLKNTDKETLSSWEEFSDLDKVYANASFTTSSVDGWMTLKLDTEFEYTGGGIIVIAWDRTGSTSYKSGCMYTDIGAQIALYSTNSTLTEENYLTYSPSSSTRQPSIKFTFADVQDDLEPAVPTNFTATTVDHKSISLSWDAAENAKGYNIYKDGTKIASTSNLSYLVNKDLEPSTDYCFYVTAVRGAKESNPSNEDCATTSEFDGCYVDFILSDEYGDGWNGGKLTLSFSDGTPNQDLTIANGKTATYTLEINKNTEVTVTYTAGSYAYENSYIIQYADGEYIYSASGGGSDMSTSFTVNCSATVIPTPEYVNLGDVRMGEFWTEKDKTATINIEVKKTSVDDVYCDSEFFVVNYDANTSTINVGYNENAGVTGIQAGDITITADGAEDVIVPVEANAYISAVGDVIENPIMVVFENDTYTYSINTLEGLYDDYIFSQGEPDYNCPDVVFELTLDEDALITVPSYDVINNNGSYLSIYEEFSSENGPKYRHDYPDNRTLLAAGTYYVVVAPNNVPFNLSITKEEVPAPEISYNYPNLGAINLDNPTLSWNVKYASEYQLLFGTSEESLEVIQDWTSEIAYSYQTINLENNTKYYWQVNARNEVGTTNGEVMSFVSTLPAPSNLKVKNDLLVAGNDTLVLTWDVIEDAISYNVYKGWELIANVTEASYLNPNIQYDINGSKYSVSAVYTLGESNTVSAGWIYITGKGIINLTVTDNEGNPIKGANVAITGNNELGEYQPYNFVTDENGQVIETVVAGYSYTVTITRYDYKESVNAGIAITYDAEKSIEVVMESLTEMEFTVTATEDGNNVNVDWTAVDGATKYNVYRMNVDTEEVESIASGITAQEYQDETWAIIENGTYKYGVSAVVEQNQEYQNNTFGYNDLGGWTTSHSGSTSTYDWKSAYYINCNYTYIYANSSYAAFSVTNRYYSDYGVNKYWLTSPQIDLTDAMAPVLSFYYLTPDYYYTPNANNYYQYTNLLKVQVSTDGTNWNDEWDSGRLSNTSWKEVPYVELTKYKGQKIYLRFETDTYGGYCTGIDDIVIKSDFSSESKVNWSEPIEKVAIEFTGAEDNDWLNANNWSTGSVPTENDNVIVTADAVISSDANVNVKNLNIKSGNLTIEGVLAVTGTITNNGNLIINDGAELFQNNEDINATFNMSIISPDQWESNNQNGWQFISSPFVDATVASFIPSEGEYDLYKYDGTQEFEWVNHKGGNSDVPETGADTEFFFDFESGTFEGLRSIDGDGDGEEWYLANGSSQGGIGEGYAINSSCYQDGELNPENYIVTTQKYAITETSTFSFFHIQVDAMFYHEYISVVISEDNMNFVPIHYYDYNSALYNWREETVELGDYAGKELYLGLCHHNCDGNTATGIKVDNIRLSSGSRSQTRGTSSFEETFAQGVGYLASYEKAATVALNGELHPNTSKTWGQYYYNAEKDLANFHLLGNPFSFNMDMSKLNSLGMVNGYAVVNANGEYEYKTDGIVNVGDGFFVKVKENYATLTYDHSYVAPVLRGSAKANSINIIASGKAGKDNVVVNFAGKAEGFNKLQNFNDAIATVYVSENGKHYGIANVDENTTEVALNFNAKEMGNYSISLDVNGKFEAVTLVDRFTGIETNMLLEDEYTFTATSNDNPNRFVIRLDNGQQTTDNGQFVYQSGEELILSIEGHVQIVDMLGRVVYSNEHANGDNRISVSEFNNAAYVVRVINEEGVKTQKVVIY